MLRLLLDGNEMDLYENESVNLTLQFADIQNINTSTGSFSQTFRIPATQNNLDYFGPIDKSTTVGGLNLKQRIPAELLSGSVPILRGFCQVKAIYLQKEKYADIEVVFFAGSVDLKTQLAGKRLRDLDLSAYDHILNATNVQQSWLGTGIGPEIRYGLVDKGFNWSSENPPWTSTDGLWQGQLTPFIRAKVIFDAIMDDAGFAYDSSFLTANGTGNFSEMYVPCLNGRATLNDDAQEDQTAAVGKDGDRTGTTGLAVFQMVDTIDNSTDPNDNWTTTGAYKYTAPYTGYYKIRFYCKWEKSDAAHYVKVYLYVNGAEVATLVDTTKTSASYLGFPRFTNAGEFTWDDGEWHTGYQGGVLSQTYVLGQGFLLESGDDIAIYREMNGTTAKIWGGGTNTPEVGKWHTTSFEVYEVSSPLSGQSVTIADNLPDFSQLDFVLGLQRMFNLVFVPDKHRPDVLLIEPFSDYTSAGNAKDWTEKVDYSNDVTLAPTTDLQSEEYSWTYTEGKDFISTSIQNALGRVYGRYRVTEPDNDFATGTKEVKTAFGQFLTSLVPGTTFAIHRSLMPDGTILKEPLPMFAYWHGLSQQFGTWYLRDDSGVTGSGSDYFPSFSNYSTDFADVGDKDLNYGMEAPFFPVVANPVNTLYFEYWAQYVTELYSEEARTMKCTMRLTASDIAQFEFSDRIFIRDSYWRVLKLAYDANVEGVCQVELIKELSDIEVCEDVPTAWDDRANYIRFNNSSAASPDFGSRRCCELYGFSWVANSTAIGGVTPLNVCKPILQTTAPNSDETS